MKKMNKKGFTLMEMLIVVAIIGILVAIAIPTFSSSLTKSKQAADEANVRAAYAEAMTKYLTENTEATVTTAAMQANQDADYAPTGGEKGKPGWTAGGTVTVKVSTDKNDKATVAYSTNAAE